MRDGVLELRDGRLARERDGSRGELAVTVVFANGLVSRVDG